MSLTDLDNLLLKRVSKFGQKLLSSVKKNKPKSSRRKIFKSVSVEYTSCDEVSLEAPE